MTRDEYFELLEEQQEHSVVLMPTQITAKKSEDDCREKESEECMNQ